MKREDITRAARQHSEIFGTMSTPQRSVGALLRIFRRTDRGGAKRLALTRSARSYLRMSSIEKPPLRGTAGLRGPLGLCAVADGLEEGRAPASGLLVGGRAKALCARAEPKGRAANGEEAR